MARGTLRVYLGMAPGVGKTYAMLAEGQRRRGRGTDVVIGFVETYNRPKTMEMAEGLEVVPLRRIPYRGTIFEEMDADAVLARRPQVALVDELAHSNVPGSKHDKRWQDVEELIDAGIDVVTTVNIQHLESLNDVVQRITGIKQRETIPDAVVRRADQIEVVDIAPEALRRRMTHGNIYPPERIDAALSNYFRTGNLTALRELALLWTAERVDEGLQRYRSEHGIEQPWEARERIVVALAGGPEGEALIRRAARITARTTGADLLGVHVARSGGLTETDPAHLGRQRALLESVGGSWHHVVGDDIAVALIDFAGTENATQLVLGVSRRGRLATFLAGEGLGARVARLSGHIDVHLVTHDAAGRGRGPELPSLGHGFSRRRRLEGAALAVVLLAVLTPMLASGRGNLNLSSDILVYLGAVIAVALTGGVWPALGAAVAAGLLLDYYFVPPYDTLAIGGRKNALALGVFVVTATLVAALVERTASRSKQAARAAAEASTLSALAGNVLRGETALPMLLERARETFGLSAVSLLQRDSDRPEARWQVVASVGEQPPTAEADLQVPISDTLTLAGAGGPLRAEDQRVLAAYAAQAAVVWERQLLAEQAAEAEEEAEVDRVRGAALAALGHDLRESFTAVRTAVTGLASPPDHLSDAVRGELVAAAQHSLDQLAPIVENLLDLSRLQSGALEVVLRPVALDDLVPQVLEDLGPHGQAVDVDMPDNVPEVLADPALLERVLANLIADATRSSSADVPPAIVCTGRGDRVEIRVIDRRPAVSQDGRRHSAQSHEPADEPETSGAGISRSLSRGLTEAMGGTLTTHESPGGGWTTIVALRAAGEPVASPPDG